LRKRIKDFGPADSFVLATAKVLKAKIVSGDEHFKNLKNVIFIKA
jgi:predicted nucleic acid-binding protein